MTNASKEIPRLSESDKERFFGKITTDGANGCHVWIGSTDRHGYGKFSIKNRIIGAHRLAFVLAYDEQPLSFLVCHHCDNTKCVNPEHLFKGTSYDNMQDMKRKERNIKSVGENQKSSKLSSSDVREIRDKYESGQESRVSLSRIFGVSVRTVGRIITFEDWQHVK
jgi:hypothetical protein